MDHCRSQGGAFGAVLELGAGLLSVLQNINQQLGNIMNRDELEPKLDAILAKQDEAISELEPLKTTVDELRAELAAMQQLTPSVVEKLDRLEGGATRLANIIQPAEQPEQPEQPTNPVEPEQPPVDPAAPVDPGAPVTDFR